MKKININQLVIAIVLIAFVGYNLVDKYASFVFHAYGNTYYQGIYETNTTVCTVDDFLVLQNGQEYLLGNALVTINDLEQYPVDTLSFDITLGSAAYHLDYSVESENTVRLSTLSLEQYQSNYISLTISNTTTMEDTTISLASGDFLTYNSTAKNYSLEDFYVDDNLVCFGYLSCFDESVVETYPKISIEYCYDVDGEDRIFYLVAGNTADYINSDLAYYTYVEDDLSDKELKVIVILQGEEDYAFELPLTLVGGEAS